MLHACLPNTSYVTQVEGSRACHLWDSIHVTGEVEFYRRRVLTALQVESDEDDANQLFDFARLFAEFRNSRPIRPGRFCRRVNALSLEESAGGQFVLGPMAHGAGPLGGGRKARARVSSCARSNLVSIWLVYLTSGHFGGHTVSITSPSGHLHLIFPPPEPVDTTTASAVFALGRVECAMLRVETRASCHRQQSRAAQNVHST